MSAAIDRWVARVNKSAREMDETAASLHPSAWREALKPQREAFKKLCAAPTSGQTRGEQE